MDKLSRSEFALFLYYYLRRIKIDSPNPNLKDAFESYKKNSKITQEKLINDYNIDHEMIGTVLHLFHFVIVNKTLFDFYNFFLNKRVTARHQVLVSSDNVPVSFQPVIKHQHFFN